MSQAFVKEGENQWLHEIPPTLHALTLFLTRENNHIRVYLKKHYFHTGLEKEVYEMSDGLSYATDEHSRWYILPD
jgi:hypothetical protein